MSVAIANLAVTLQYDADSVIDLVLEEYRKHGKQVSERFIDGSATGLGAKIGFDQFSAIDMVIAAQSPTGFAGTLSWVDVATGLSSALTVNAGELVIIGGCSCETSYDGRWWVSGGGSSDVLHVFIIGDPL